MLASLPLFFVGVLAFFALLLIVIRLLRPDFGYSWLIAAFGALIVWALILTSRLNLPQTIMLSIWSLPGISSTRAILVLDGISWSYAFSLGTILLAVVLTDVARAQESDWSAWTASLILTALGLLVVLAGNPLTLILAWAALDFAEILVLLWHVHLGEGRRQAALIFTAKVISLSLLLWAWILASQFGPDTTFADLPEQACVFMLLAGWIRAVVVPLRIPRMHEQSIHRGLGTLLRLVSTSAALVLFTRTSRLGVIDWQEPYLIALAGITALYGGLSWMYSRDGFAGHAYWIIGIAALVMASAIRGEETASMAWGLSGLLSGALLFLYSFYGRWLVTLPALGLVQMTSLPLTQAWNGVALYGADRLVFSLFFLISQALLLAGYYLKGVYLKREKPGAERWVVVIYIWGLVLIALSQILLAFWGNIINGSWATPVNLATIIPGITACALAAFLIFMQQRGFSIPERSVSVIGSIFSLNWLYRLVGQAYDLVGKGVALATLVLEGEGGILWALLWLILLLALIAQGVIRGI